MDLYYIEICRDNRPVNPGELGRVYLTDLTNKAMPLIRYEIGDLARFVQNEHDCRFSADRIEVVGRIEDTLVNNQGRIFSSDEVFDFFHSHAEINNFQLIEKGHKSFELLVVPNQELTIHKEKLTNEFNEFYGEKSQINFHLVRTINSENGGKFRFVKSLSHSKI